MEWGYRLPRATDFGQGYGLGQEFELGIWSVLRAKVSVGDWGKT